MSDKKRNFEAEAEYLQYLSVKAHPIRQKNTKAGVPEASEWKLTDRGSFIPSRDIILRLIEWFNKM